MLFNIFLKPAYNTWGCRYNAEISLRPSRGRRHLPASLNQPHPPGVLYKHSALILAACAFYKIFCDSDFFPERLEWIVKFLGSFAAKRRHCWRTCSHLTGVPARCDFGLIRKRKHRPPVFFLAPLLSLRLLPSACFSSSTFQKSQTRWFESCVCHFYRYIESSEKQTLASKTSTFRVFFCPSQPCCEGEGPGGRLVPGAPQSPQGPEQNPRGEDGPQEGASQCHQLNSQQLSSATCRAAAAAPNPSGHACCQPGVCVCVWASSSQLLVQILL